MLISITGRLGSGKSTVCGILNQKYGFEIFSTGTINREFARRLGITTLELNEKVQAQWKFFEHEQHKRRRCYVKDI